MRLGFFVHSLFCCSLAAAGVIRAQQPAAATTALQPHAADTITLSELLKRARKDPPAVRRAVADLERTRADLRAASAAWYPAFSVEGGAGLRYTNQLIVPGYPRLDSSSYELRSQAALDWSLINLSRGATISAREISEQMELANGLAAQRVAVAQAAELYLRAGASSDLIDDAKLSFERRTRQHQAISDLVRTGSRSPVEAERTKVELLSAKYMLAMRESDEAAAFAALAVAIGRPATRPVRPATRSGEFVGASAVISAERALDLARKNRPEVKSAVFAISALSEDYRAAILDRLPTLGVNGSGNASYSDVVAGNGINGSQYGGAVGVYVRWRGFDPAIWLKADIAEASKQQAERQLELTQQNVSAESVAAFYALQRAKLERERAIEVLLAAGATREAQNDRYRVGVGSLLELLDAENLEQDARQRRIEAERDEAITAARLLATCGLMEP
jgi:outer membrane protein